MTTIRAGDGIARHMLCASPPTVPTCWPLRWWPSRATGTPWKACCAFWSTANTRWPFTRRSRTRRHQQQSTTRKWTRMPCLAIIWWPSTWTSLWCRYSGNCRSWCRSWVTVAVWGVTLWTRCWSTGVVLVTSSTCFWRNHWAVTVCLYLSEPAVAVDGDDCAWPLHQPGVRAAYAVHVFRARHVLPADTQRRPEQNQHYDRTPPVKPSLAFVNTHYVTEPLRLMPANRVDIGGIHLKTLEPLPAVSNYATTWRTILQLSPMTRIYV